MVASDISIDNLVLYVEQGIEALTRKVIRDDDGILAKKVNSILDYNYMSFHPGTYFKNGTTDEHSADGMTVSQVQDKIDNQFGSSNLSLVMIDHDKLKLASKKVRKLLDKKSPARSKLDSAILDYTSIIKTDGLYPDYRLTSPGIAAYIFRRDNLLDLSCYGHYTGRKAKMGVSPIRTKIKQVGDWFKEMGSVYSPTPQPQVSFRDPLKEFRDLAIENGRKNDAAVRKANKDTLYAAAERAIDHLKKK